MPWDKNNVRHFIGVCMVMPAIVIFFLSTSLYFDPLAAKRDIPQRVIDFFSRSEVFKASMTISVGAFCLGLLMGKKQFQIQEIYWAILAAAVAGFVANLIA